MERYRHIFNADESSKLNSILNRNRQQQRRPPQQIQQQQRRPPQQIQQQQRRPPQQIQQQQRPEDPTVSRETFNIKNNGTPNFQANLKPLEVVDDGGPKAMSSFDNVSSIGFASDFAGVSLGAMGIGCDGKALPPSKVNVNNI